jgi:hypothetical protein
MELVRMRLPFARGGAVSLALATLGACATDPATSGADWRHSHPSVDSSLIRAVNWPGTKTSRIEGDAHGFRAVLKFPGDDSDMGAVVQVLPAKDDPCKEMPYLISDTGIYHPDPKTYGDTAFVLPACTPAGKNAWELVSHPHDGDPWTGYAERRDGILLILSNYDDWTNPHFRTIAATLHQLDDKQLGSML